MDQQSLVESQSAGSNIYAFDGQMLIISATATVFLIVVLLASIHLYARWWLRREATSAAHVVVPAAADRGLDPAVLSSLPVFTFSSKSPAPAPERILLECAVCLSEFEEEETVRLLPSCNHAFHIECIDMWFHSHTTCPLCRSPVEPAAGEEPGSSEMMNIENIHGTASLGARRREEAMDHVKIDVGPPAEFGNEQSDEHQSSPHTIAGFLTFKRLLSMGRKSPVGGRAAETSGSS